MSGISPGWRKPRNHAGVFLDRCLDRRLAIELRKIPHVTARGLEEIYGDDATRPVEDVEFLTDAGRHGWMVWTQNPRMWTVPHEHEAIRQHGTHVYCLGSAQLFLPGKAFVFGRWWMSIQRRQRRADACFWRLYPEKVLKDLR